MPNGCIKVVKGVGCRPCVLSSTKHMAAAHTSSACRVCPQPCEPARALLRPSRRPCKPHHLRRRTWPRALACRGRHAHAPDDARHAAPCVRAARARGRSCLRSGAVCAPQTMARRTCGWHLAWNTAMECHRCVVEQTNIVHDIHSTAHSRHRAIDGVMTCRNAGTLLPILHAADGVQIGRAHV